MTRNKGAPTLTQYCEIFWPRAIAARGKRKILVFVEHTIYGGVGQPALFAYSGGWYPGHDWHG